MKLEELQADVLRISDIYAAEHDIDRDGDWALLKLQEELGELTAEHLRLSGRARGEPDARALGDEAAANDALRHASVEWIGGQMSLAEA